MNMLALNADIAQTMSSREIADLTGKRHPDVKRDCDVMFLELNLDVSSFARIYFDSMNRQQTEYMLTHELVQTLITGYSIKLRHAVIQRLNELDAAKTAQPHIDPMVALSDPNALRGLLLGYSEKVIALETKVIEMQTDVSAFERIAKADGSLCMRDAANNLQIRPKDLNRFLVAHGWIYKRNGNDAWHGYSDKLTSGYLEHKSTTVKASDGITDKITEQVRITPKGLAKLAKHFTKGDAA